MVRKIGAWIGSASLLVSNLLFVPPVYAAQGIGTQENPIVITTCTELQDMKNNLTASYALGNDIDCSDTVNWNGGQGFEPVGNSTTKFAGNFDGRGHKISHLTIIRPSEIYLGLFGYAEGSEVVLQNVSLDQVTVQNNTGLAGSLLGYGFTGVVIKNVNVTGTIEGGDYVGGLISYFRGTLIDNVHVQANVSGDEKVGGIVGSMSGATGGTVSHSSYSGVLTGASNVGGLVGYSIVSGIVNESYSEGTLIGIASSYSGQLGGIIGGTKASSFDNVYSAMDIECTSCSTSVGKVGGAIGYMESGTVNRIYSTGKVTTNVTSKGGLIGNYVAGTVTNSYWDKTTSTLTTSSGNKGIGKTTAEMKQLATFNGWDFTNTWVMKPTIHAGYPTLKKTPYPLYQDAENVQETHTASSISLSWTNPQIADFQYVTLYRNGAKIWQGTSSSFTDTNLTGDTTYSYKLTATDTRDNASNGVTLIVKTTDNIPPASVSGFTAQEKDEGVQLTWTNPLDADWNHVRIERNGVNVYTGSGVSYVDATTQEKVAYTYTIWAYDTNGNESAPQSYTVTTADKTAPQEVTSLTLKEDNGDLFLSWALPLDDDVYGVVIRQSGLVVYEGTETTFRQINAVEKQTYTYIVQTVDEAGNLSQGVTTSIRTKDRTAPDAVQDFKAVEQEGAVWLAWQNPSNDDIKKVVVKRNGLVLYEGTDQAFKDQVIDEKQVYTYEIAVYDHEGNVSLSRSYVLTTSDKTSPQSPMQFITTEKEKRVVATWENPLDSDFSYVELYKQGMLLYTGTKKSYQDNDTVEGMTYTYKLIAYDESGNASLASLSTIRTSLAPLKPVDQVSLMESNNGVTIQWTNPKDNRFSHVLLYRDGQLIGKTSSTSYTDKGTGVYTRYTYQLVTVSQDGTKLSPATFSYQTRDKNPEAVVNVSAVYQTNAVQLTWTSSDGNAKEYRIYRNQLYVGSTSSLRYEDKTVEEGNTYSYTVYAVSQSNLLSTPSLVSVQIPTSKEDKKEEMDENTKEPMAPELSSENIKQEPVLLSAPIANEKAEKAIQTKPLTKAEVVALTKSVTPVKKDNGYVLTWTPNEKIEKVLIYKGNELIGETTDHHFFAETIDTTKHVTYHLVFVAFDGTKTKRTVSFATSLPTDYTQKPTRNENDTEQKTSIANEYAERKGMTPLLWIGIGSVALAGIGIYMRRR